MVEASQGEGASLSPWRPQVWKCGKRPTMRLQKIKTEYPFDRSPMKNGLNDLVGTIGSDSSQIWFDLSPGEIGGWYLL